MGKTSSSRFTASRRDKTKGSWRLPYLPSPIIMVVVVVILLGGIWIKLSNPNTLRFKHINIVADYSHIPQAKLKNIVANNLHGGFFSLDEAHLKQALMALPWINNVALRRVWPSTLVVTLQEQQAIARWGHAAVVNQQGQLFYPDPETIPHNIPLLQGPSNSQNILIANYQSFSQQLSGLGLSIALLQLSNRQAWMMQLTNGITVQLGRNDVALRFERFVQLYPRLIGNRANQVKTVDLRYPNGLAIQWRKKGNQHASFG